MQLSLDGSTVMVNFNALKAGHVVSRLKHRTSKDKHTEEGEEEEGGRNVPYKTSQICCTADEIPGKVKQASFMWERRAKLQYTEPSPVNLSDRTVYWGNTLLKQV